MANEYPVDPSASGRQTVDDMDNAFASLADALDDMYPLPEPRRPAAEDAIALDESSLMEAALAGIDAGFPDAPRELELAPAGHATQDVAMRYAAPPPAPVYAPAREIPAAAPAAELPRMPQATFDPAQFDMNDVAELPVEAIELEPGLAEAELRGSLLDDFSALPSVEDLVEDVPAAPQGRAGLAASVEELFRRPEPAAPQAVTEPVSQVGAIRLAGARETHLAIPEAPAAEAPATVAHLSAAMGSIEAPYVETPATETFILPAPAPVPAPEMSKRIDDDLDFYDIVTARGAARTAASVNAPASAPVPAPYVPAAVPAQAEAPRAAMVAQDELDELPSFDVSDLELAQAAEPAFAEPAEPRDSIEEFTAYFDEQNATLDPLAPPAELEPDYGDETAAALPPPVAARGRSRAFWVAGIVVAVALVGSLAMFSGSIGDLVAGSDTTDEPPVTVRADNEPVRVAPENPGGTPVPNQDSVVMNQVAGAGQAQPQPEVQQPTLVEGREEPTISGAPVKGEDRVPAGGNDEAAPALGEGIAVQPRAVQTVTVRPDGTLVVESPSAAAPELPAAAESVVPEQRPAVAEAPVAPDTTDIASAPAPEPAPAPAQPEQETAAQSGVAEQVAPREVATQEIRPSQPVEPALPAEILPESRPADQPVTIAAAEQPAPEPAPQPEAAPAAEAAPAEQTAVAPGGFAMQISSQPTEAAATKSLQDLSKRFGSVLAGRDYAIQKAEVPGKGTFFRVRILASSREDANALCGKYKAAGGSCFVTK